MRNCVLKAFPPFLSGKGRKMRRQHLGSLIRNALSQTLFKHLGYCNILYTSINCFIPHTCLFINATHNVEMILSVLIQTCIDQNTYLHFLYQILSRWSIDNNLLEPVHWTTPPPLYTRCPLVHLCGVTYTYSTPVLLCTTVTLPVKVIKQKMDKGSKGIFYMKIVSCFISIFSSA